MRPDPIYARVRMPSTLFIQCARRALLVILGVLTFHLSASAQTQVSAGGTGQTFFTPGGVLFGAGPSPLLTDPSLSWDNTNKRLSVAASSQGPRLFVQTTGSNAELALNTDTGNGTFIQHRLNGTMRFQYGITSAGDWEISSFNAAGVWLPPVKMHITSSNGNVGIGTTAPASRLHVAGDITVTGNINAKYQDLAEWVPSRVSSLRAGTVVVIDDSASNGVVPSEIAYDTRVAGVVSETPGVLLGEAGEGKTKIATTGRVRVRVNAAVPIQVGDLLVTSSVAGLAMKSIPVSVGDVLLHRPGTLIGKALEPLPRGEGEILVLLSLQ